MSAATKTTCSAESESETNNDIRLHHCGAVTAPPHSRQTAAAAEFGDKPRLVRRSQMACLGLPCEHAMATSCHQTQGQNDCL